MPTIHFVIVYFILQSTSSISSASRIKSANRTVCRVTVTSLVFSSFCVSVMLWSLMSITMVCPGSAVCWNRQRCNRQSMQQVQKTWSIGTGLLLNALTQMFSKQPFFDSGRKKNKRSSLPRHWRQNQRLAFQKLFILPLSWVTFLPVTVLWIVWICD